MSSLSSNAPPTPAATAAVAKSRGTVAKLVVPRNGWYVAYAFDPESSSGCVGVHISARGYPDMTCGWWVWTRLLRLMEIAVPYEARQLSRADCSVRSVRRRFGAV